MFNRNAAAVVRQQVVAAVVALCFGCFFSANHGPEEEHGPEVWALPAAVWLAKLLETLPAKSLAKVFNKLPQQPALPSPAENVLVKAPRVCGCVRAFSTLPKSNFSRIKNLMTNDACQGCAVCKEARQ
jgi:hypothetical protein